jgi:vanillate O-demethylase monooxygenase subunit
VERSWFRAVRADEVGVGAVCAVELEGPGRLAVWRTGDGQLVALDDRCPHQWSSLAIAGDVEGCELVCTTHGWRFGVDGRASKRSMLGRRDDKGETTTWPVREVDGWIEVQV